MVRSSKLATLLVFAVCCTAVGISARLCPRVAVAESPQAKLALDRYGDPVEESFFDRIGSMRLQPAGEVTNVSFSLDNRFLVTSAKESRRNTVIEVWDATTWKRIRRLPVGADGVSGVSFSPDSKLILFTTSKGYFLQDVQGKESPRKLDLDGGRAVFLDSNRILTSSNSEIRVWQIEPRAQLHLEKSEKGKFFETVVASRDGSVVAAMTSRGKVILWRSKDFNRLRELSLSTTGLPFALSSDGTMVACLPDSSTLRLVELSDDPLSKEVEFSGLVRHIEFLPTGELMLAKDGGVVVRIAGDLTISRRFDFPLRARTEHVAIAADGRRAVICSSSNAPLIVDLATGKPELLGERLLSPVQSLAFSSSGGQLLVNGEMHSWEPRKSPGEVRATSEIRRLDLGWGQGLVSTESGIDVLDPTDFSRQATVPFTRKHLGDIVAAHIPRRGDLYLVTKRAVERWNITNPDSPVFVTAASEVFSAPQHCAVSSDGVMAALAAENGRISKILMSGDPTASITPLMIPRSTYWHAENRMFCFGAGRNLLITRGGSWRYQISNIETGADVGGVRGKLLSGSVVVRPGSLFAVGRFAEGHINDARIGVFETATWELVADIPTPATGVTAMAVSRKGDKVAVATPQFTVNCWQPKPLPDTYRTKAFDELWRDLGSSNVDDWHLAFRRLCELPIAEVNSGLSKALALPPDLGAQLSRIDDDDFSVREAASIQMLEHQHWIDKGIHAGTIKGLSREANSRIKNVVEHSAARRRFVSAVHLLELGDQDSALILTKLSKELNGTASGSTVGAAILRQQVTGRAAGR